MQILEIRPARVQAKYVRIGDMLVVSPIGADGPRPSQWIGQVTQHVDPVDGNPDHEQWRIQQPDGRFIESAPVPADGFVWVHLPSAPAPEPVPDPIETSGTITGEIVPEWLAR